MPIIGSFSALPARALGLANFVVAGEAGITSIDTDVNSTTGEQVDIYFTAGTTGTTPVTNYEYSTDGGSNWTALNPADTTSPLRITGLTNGQEYDFAIRSLQDGIPSPASNVVAATPVALPGAPSITSINEDANGTTGEEVDISFSAGSAGTDSTTQYQYRIGSGSWVNAGTTSPFTVTGLTNGETYSFTMRAVMGSFVSATSGAVSGRPVALPTAPSISSVNATTGALSISFSASTAGTDAIGTYQYSLDDGSTWNNRPSGTTASPISGISVTDADVVDGDYDSKVRIRAKAGSYYSAASGAATPSHPAPGRPPGYSVTATPTSLTFTVSESTAGAYAIDRYQYSSNNSTWYNIGTTNTERTKSFTGLATSTDYTRYFRAVDAEGQASASRTATGTTSDEVAPGTPSAPTVSADGTTSLSVDYSTTTKGTYNIDKYQYRYRVSGGTYGSATDVGSDPFTISSLSVDTTYNVQIRAVSTTGLAGSWSTAGNGTTDPNTPSSPTLSFRSTNASERSVAKLEWTAQTYATTYHLYKKTNGGDDEFVDAYTTTEADVSVSAGSSYQFFVYAGNRLGNFSAASGSKYMTVGQYNIPWDINIDEFGPVTNLALIGSCATTDANVIKYYWGFVPSSATSAGWKKVEYVGAYFQSANANMLTVSSSSRKTYIDVSGTGNRQLIQGGLTTYDYQLHWVGGLNISGSSLNNGFLKLYVEGTGWTAYNSSCNPSSTFYLRAYNLYATGRETTASTYS